MAAREPTAAGKDFTGRGTVPPPPGDPVLFRRWHVRCYGEWETNVSQVVVMAMTQLGPLRWSPAPDRRVPPPSPAVAGDAPIGDAEGAPVRRPPAGAPGASPGPGLIGQIFEDWKVHGRDWSRPGFQALAVHRFGNWRMNIRSRLVRAPFSVLYRTLFRLVRNVYGIELPYSAQVGRRVVFEHQGGIVVHGNAVVGDECIIRQGVTLGNRTLDRPFEAPRLGKRVNVGAGAKILGDVAIGDDAEIGANAVVRADVGPGELVAGVPARVVERRHPPLPSTAQH